MKIENNFVSEAPVKCDTGADETPVGVGRAEAVSLKISVSCVKAEAHLRVDSLGFGVSTLNYFDVCAFECTPFFKL